MRRLLFILFILCFLGFVPAAHAADEPNEVALKRVGWVEKISISEVGTVLKAKLDTGAKTSSIDADIIDIRTTGKQVDGVTSGDTVLFSIALEDGAKKTFEREVKRYVRIKKKGGGFNRRPVIVMNFCIAGRKVQEEVNLANREGFVYPVLIGRNMMQHANLVIDAGKMFITRPKCDD